MSIINITTFNYNSEILNSDKTVLLYFRADWCGPCSMLSPIIDEIANEHHDIKVCKVNIDEQQELATKFQIMSIPTLIVIKNGNITTKSMGVISKDKISSMLL